MKKLLTIFLSMILAFGALSLVGCGKTDSMTNKTSDDTSSDKTLSVQSVTVPKIGGKILTNYTTRSGQAGISKRITATVLPADAANKLVDYRLFWISDAEKADEPVSDYVVIEQDSDGSASATITCIQPFGSDSIVAQVVTREGKYTSECVLTYEGLISTMAISTEDAGFEPSFMSGKPTSNYLLLTNNTYSFTIDMDNELHNVSYDLTASVVATGVDADNWVEFYDYANYVNVSFVPAYWMNSETYTRYSLLDIWDWFFSYSINDNILTITTGDKKIENYYVEVSDTERENLFMQSSQSHSGYTTLHFSITVTDAKTNISETIRFCIDSGVDSVSLSAQSIVF